MIHFVFTERDNRYLFLKGDSEIDEKNLQLLKEHLNLVDPICYLPTYTGIPFTQDFLFEYTQTFGNKIYYCSIGLWQEIYKFFKANEIEYDGLDSERFKRKLPHSFEEFKEIVNSWNLKFEPRPYQYEGAYKILQWNKSLSQFATRAGKTMLAYIVFRYAMEYLGAKNILMIVPSIDLVKQGYTDFKEYADFFDTECLWAGGKLVESSNLTIGTFQSLIKFLDKKSKKYNPHFFDKFNVVFVDEVHRATASQTKTIISQPFMKNLIIGFGMTGTLPNEKTIERYTLAALLGAKIQEISPKELMDNGYISKVHITQIRLSYKNKEYIEKLWCRCAEYRLSRYCEDENGNKIKVDNPKFLYQYKKELPFALEDIKSYCHNPEQYMDMLKPFITDSTSTNNLAIEQMMIHFLSSRVNYLINNILSRCNGGTIILCQHVEYIKYIVDELSKTKDNVYMVTGSVNAKKRNEIKKQLVEHPDYILVASYATSGTGLTFPKLFNVILFESFKSNVINMQSIGRGLGLVDEKYACNVYDIIDDLPTKKILLQGKEKLKIYKREKYPYRIEKAII